MTAAGRGGEQLADRDRAGEGDEPDDRRGDQVRGDLGRFAEDEVEHTGREAGVVEAAHQRARRWPASPRRP